MITGAETPAWPGKIAVADLIVAGLPAPSVVPAARLSALEARDAARSGRLPAADRDAVAAELPILLAGVLGTPSP
jgi:mRNA interferase MazF